MPYHHNSQNNSSSRTTTQSKVAPPGFHYMPDGTLMSDTEHAAKYGSSLESGQNLEYNICTDNIPSTNFEKQSNGDYHIWEICAINQITGAQPAGISTSNMPGTVINFNPGELIGPFSFFGNPLWQNLPTYNATPPMPTTFPWHNYFYDWVVQQVGVIIIGDKIELDVSMIQAPWATPMGSGATTPYSAVCTSSLTHGLVGGATNKICITYIGMSPHGGWPGGQYLAINNTTISVTKNGCDCKYFGLDTTTTPYTPTSGGWNCVEINENQGQLGSAVDKFGTGGAFGCVEVFLPYQGQYATKQSCMNSGCGVGGPNGTTPISYIPRITDFDCDLQDIQEAGETRKFSITGNSGAEFYLEIKNEDGTYYNFVCDEFQTGYHRLDGVIENKSYNNSIAFPRVTDNDQYNIYLYAKPGTKHLNLNQILFKDNSIDKNASKGSDSLLLEKVIYQILDVTATLSSYSPTSAITLSGSVNDTIELGRYKSSGKAFSLTARVASNAISVDRQPTENDLLAFISPVVGSAPITIPGENVYPAVSDTDTVDGAIVGGGSVVKVVMDNNVANKMVVGDKITAPVTTDTVDGAVSSGIKVVMDNNVAGKMAIGDRITGDEISAIKVVTVAALNPDGDNVKEFSMSEAIALSDGVTLTFSPKCNRSLTTVAVLNPDGDNVKEFSMSQNVGLLDGVVLSFSNQINYQWPINNVNNLIEDMIVITDTNILTSTTLSIYEDITTIDACTENEKDIIHEKRSAVDKSQTIPTIVNGITTIQAGNIVFNKQQKLALAGDTIKVGGYGLGLIAKLTGWDVEINNLKLELNTITTTTTADTSGNPSTTIAVASAVGIADATTQTVDLVGDVLAKLGLTSKITKLDSVSGLRVGQALRAMSVGTLSGNPVITTINEANKTITLSLEQTFANDETLTFSNSDISGIGIDSKLINPYVTNISSLNLTSSVAQAIESGQTLTFSGSGNIATITGNIVVKKAGPLDLPLYLDVEKFLTFHS